MFPAHLWPCDLGWMSVNSAGIRVTASPTIWRFRSTASSALSTSPRSVLSSAVEKHDQGIDGAASDREYADLGRAPAGRAREGYVRRIGVNELAIELGMVPRDVLQLLRDLGEVPPSEESGLDDGIVARVRTIAAAQRAAASRPFDPSSPSARETGWHAGAVRRPDHPDLLVKIRDVSARYPALRAHIRALDQLGSQVVYANWCTDRTLAGAAVVLVRFSGAIESAFGFTREAMILYTPYQDLQVRTFQAARREMAALRRPITPDIFFIWAPDSRLRTKLDDWSQPANLAIPLDLADDDEPIAFVTLLRDYIYSRDLFYETTPVSGARFFGRKTLLQSLRDDVHNQRVAGIFGLRKAGKTSILVQLREYLEAEGIVTVLLDLESFPSPPDDPTEDIIWELRRRFQEEFRARGLRTKELADLPEYPSILEFKNAVQSILRRDDTNGHKVVLMLDEIEYLTPADQIDVAEGNMPRVAQMLSALRGLVQETDRFAFLLSGLTSAIIEGGRLYGRPNPLFSWAKAYYIGALEREETDLLATALGAKMGIRIEDGALEALHEASGGHAFLYRNLASASIETLPVDSFQRSISRSMILHSLGDWTSRIRGNIDEMVQHVARYYPTEAILLDLLRAEPDDFPSLAQDEPVAVRHLMDLGLIRREGGNYELNQLLELM